MTRIAYADLMAKLADPATDESDLAPYFMLDEAASDAFAPRFRVNPETVELGTGPGAAARSALLLNSANTLSRMNRWRKFSARMAKGYSGPVIVAEGDSWWQYPILLKDTIDHLSDPRRKDSFAIRCLSAAGDLLSQMEKDGEYLTELAATRATILLLSGGGNDLLRKGQLADCLEAFRPGLKPTDYLTPRFDDILSSSLASYERMLRRVHGQFPGVRVIVHGYDYALPKNGPWLGRPMAKRGITDPALQAAITVDMMDRFNRSLRRIVETMPHVSYIDCRGTVSRNEWHDELHPKNSGYAKVAARIEAEIRRVSARARGALPVFLSGPFGDAATLQRAAQALEPEDLDPGTAVPPAEANAAPETRVALALSLHVGLNRIDPAHYGDDGELFGCENDARAMERLARQQGYETRMLLTEKATRTAVITEIAAAAERLQPGDSFLFTIAAHGSFLPDWNGDEATTREGDLFDETLCLYDSQIVDDELSILWTLFREGVRIVMVGDTCHSGSPVRASPFAPQPVPADPTLRPRHLPFNVSMRTFRQHEQEYRARTLSLAGIDERVLERPLPGAPKATVLGLGACQDEQVAMDGPFNGAFTTALLKVWDDGRFDGDWRSFRHLITGEINSPSQIPSLDTQLVPQHDRGFLAQVPFSPWPRDAGPAPESAVAAPAVARMLASDTAQETGTGAEIDEPDDDTGVEAAQARTLWTHRAAFESFHAGLGLRHFSAAELLVLGAGHGNPQSPGFGLNGYAPPDLWPNIVPAIRALDELRARLGRPVRITSAFRTDAYNATLPGAATESHHRNFRALDFGVDGISPSEAGNALRWLRDERALFKGGIGFYASFVHIDARGSNVVFRGKDIAIPAPLTASPFP